MIEKMRGLPRTGPYGQPLDFTAPPASPLSYPRVQHVSTERMARALAAIAESFGKRKVKATVTFEEPGGWTVTEVEVVE